MPTLLWIRDLLLKVLGQEKMLVELEALRRMQASSDAKIAVLKSERNLYAKLYYGLMRR